jgi:hypothetical protein
MFYDLLNPTGLVPGDVIVTENASFISDILRFSPSVGTGGVFVYSDMGPGDPADSLADIGFPTMLSTNFTFVPEVGPEGSNGIVYTPTAGQPGFITGSAGPVTYTFTSDSTAVPEPGTVGVALLGAAAMWMRRRSRFQRS